MEFLRRNINKQLRNGDIISSSISSSYIGGSNSSGGVLSGNYLPATMNDENIYIVPHYVTFQETITTTDTDGNETETIKNLLEITSNGLIVNGNIIALGEVSAYGSSSASTGSSSSGSVTIYDGLDSDSATIALSANQGRVLKNLIDTMGGNVDVDLSDYYTKEQIDDKLSNVDIDLSDYLKTTTFNTHTADTTAHITSTERTNWNTAYNNNHTHSNKSVIDGISSTNVTNWNDVVSDWNDVFSINSDGSLRVKVNLYGDGEVSAFGSGATSVDINLENYYTKDQIDGMFDTMGGNVDVDLSDYYTKTETDTKLSSKSDTGHSHNNYATTTNFNSHSGNTILHITAAERNTWNAKSDAHTHPYASSSHTHPISAITSLQSTLDGKSGTGHSHSNYVTITNFNTHSGNTTAHITSTERTNWNTAYNNNHTHSNKTVLDGITSTKVANWDKVYEDWNDVFTINSDGDLQVKVNVIGDKEISAYGSDSSTSNGAITIVDNLTSTATTAALSANQGRELKNLIDNIDVDIDLSDYSKTGHTHNEYASSSHTHPISAITSLQSTLDGKSGTGHSHSNYSLTSHTHNEYASSSHSHSNYSLTSHTHSYAAASHTHPISAITSLQSTLDGKSGTGHSHSNYSLTSHTHSLSALTSTAHTHSIYYDSTVSRTANTVLAAPNGSAGGATFRSLVAADIPSLAISKITNLQSSLDAKSGTGHSHSNYSVTSHTHNYAGSSSAGGAATSANKVNSTLTFTGGTFASKTFNGSAAVTVNVPTHTSHITNNSGYITTAATVAAANKVTSTLSFSGGTFSANSFNGSAAKTVYIPTHTSHITNDSGYITTAATVAAANKVTSTLSFSGGTFSANSFNGSAAKTVYIPTHTSHITNNSGYITTAATVTNSDKLDGYHGSSSNSGNTYVLRNSDGDINVGGINASGDTNILGNLCVTGEITAYADGGNATPFIYNATSYSSINSTATNQVPTANVAYLIKQELEDTKTRLTAAETKLNKIKTYLNSLTSSSTLANVLTALINIKNNI